jgi:hypothetical protein
VHSASSLQPHQSNMDQATRLKRARRVSVASSGSYGRDDKLASKKSKRTETAVLNMEQELFVVIPLTNQSDSFDESPAPASIQRANGSDSISNDSELSLSSETCRFPTTKLRYSSTSTLINGQYVISPRSSTSSLSSLCMERMHGRTLT